MLSYICTVNGLTVYGNGNTYTISSDSPAFKEAVQAAERQDIDAIEEIVNRVSNKLKNVNSLAPDLEYNGGVILFKGTQLEGYAIDKLIALIEQKKNPQYLANFVSNMYLNPSRETVQNLYQFLEFGKMPLTPTGNFLAYKAVRHDYMDIHSGRFNNKIGSYHTMPRNQVDDDRNQTCSYGFHVCSFDYLKHFMQADGHIMVCEVNPKHVVAIPADYNNTKLRTCAYSVVDEVKGEHRPVLSDTDFYEKSYEVYGDGSFITDCSSYEDAMLVVAEEKGHYDEIEVFDSDGNRLY